MPDPSNHDWSDNRDPAAREATHGLGFAGHIAGFALAVVIISMALMRPALQVGDIIRIDPKPGFAASAVRVEAQHVGTAGDLKMVGKGCVLALSSMGQGGGSLKLDGYDPRRMRWTASWVGRATATASGEDCGSQALLSVHQGDIDLIERLVRAGPGAEAR